MGGRGKSSGIDSRQISLNEIMERNEVHKIIEAGKEARSNGVDNTGGDGASPNLFKRCACCEEYSIPIGKLGYICPICGWIDDSYQNIHSESLNGRNNICLTEAKINYFNNV